MSLSSFVLNKSFNNFILLVIIINSITIGLETSHYVMEHIGSLLITLDHIALFIFCIEILAKIIGLRRDFIRDYWNIFDFVIIFISLLPTFGAFTVVRALRVLRVLLLVSYLPKLRLIVRSILVSLPGIGWLSILILLILYIAAIIANTLFGEAFPEWFGTLGKTFFTLFQMLTLESWSMGIARPVMQIYPYAYLFFVPFVLLTSFVILNIFIAILINGMTEAKNDRDEVSSKIEYNKVNRDELEKELATLCKQIERIQNLLKIEDDKAGAKKSKN